jgi:hypothetical protein
MSKQEVARLNLQAKADRDKHCPKAALARATKKKKTSIGSSQTTAFVTTEESIDDSIPKKNRQYPALRPENILASVKGLEQLLSMSTVNCPDCQQPIVKPKIDGIEQYGWGAEVSIHCDNCDKKVPILDDPDRLTDLPSRINHETGEGEELLRKFFQYPTNYRWIIALQDLGLGITDGIKLMAHLSVSSTGGGRQYCDWTIMEHYHVGLQEEELAHEVMIRNLDKEYELTNAEYQKEYDEWEASEAGQNASEEEKKQRRLIIWNVPAIHEHAIWLESEQGQKASDQEKEEKFKELLNTRFHLPPDDDGVITELKYNPTGCTFTFDGAWNKRAIGHSAGHSPTSHHMAIGARSGLICNVVIYSQRCRRCEKADHDGVDPPRHRCPKNFSKAKSSKSMEPSGAVQNVIDIFVKSEGKVYVYQIVTDDDSSVRANTKHNLLETLKADYPEIADILDNVKKSEWKGLLHWPRDAEGKFVMHYGKVPINIPGVYSWLADKGHRVKVIGTAMYDLIKTGVDGCKQFWKKHNAEQVKQDARDFLLNDPANMDLPFEEFAEKAPCFIEHRFDEHKNCHNRWCKLKGFEEKNDPDGAEAYRKEHPHRFKQKVYEVEDAEAKREEDLEKIKEANEFDVAHGLTHCLNLNNVRRRELLEHYFGVEKKKVPKKKEGLIEEIQKQWESKKLPQEPLDKDSIDRLVKKREERIKEANEEAVSFGLDHCLGMDNGRKKELLEHYFEVEEKKVPKQGKGLIEEIRKQWANKNLPPEGLQTDKNAKKKMKEMNLFQAVMKKMEEYLSVDRLRQVYHRWNTNRNESANQSVATCAPKHKHYGGSKSLSDRVNWVVIKLSLGYEEGLAELHEKLGIPQSPVLQQWAKKKDDQHADAIKYKHSPAYRRKRKQKRNERVKKLRKAEANSLKEGMDYRSGMDFEEKPEADDDYESELEEDLEVDPTNELGVNHDEDRHEDAEIR